MACGSLFNLTCADGLNVIGVGRGHTRVAQNSGNLPAMVGGMHGYVHQDIGDGIGPVFAFRVPVADLFAESLGGYSLEILGDDSWKRSTMLCYFG